MKRQQGIIEWAMHYYQITLLVLTVLVGLGIYGLVNMPKQEFPEFTIRQGGCRGCLSRGDFCRGGGTTGKAFGTLSLYF